jgi:hypothetical protein
MTTTRSKLPRTSAILLAASAAGAVALLSLGTADAGTFLIPDQLCERQPYSFLMGGTQYFKEAHNETPTHCPIMTGTNVDMADAWHLMVYVTGQDFDANSTAGQIRAKACRRSWSSTTFACGAYDSMTNGNGPGLLSVDDFSAFTSASLYDFMYVHVYDNSLIGTGPQGTAFVEGIQILTN